MARRRRFGRKRNFRRRRRIQFRRKGRGKFRGKRRFRRGGVSKALRHFLPKPALYNAITSQTILGVQGAAYFKMLEPVLDGIECTDMADRAYQKNLTVNGVSTQQTALDHMMKASIHHEIMNSGLSHAQVEAYWCVARRDVPEDQFENGIHADLTGTSGTGSTIYHMFNRSLVTDLNLESGTTALPATSNIDAYYKFPTYQPFQCPEFCRLFKIYKVQRFQVPPGRRFSLTQKTPWKRVHNDILQRAEAAANQGIAYLRGVGRFILLKVHGQVISNADVTSTSNNPSSELTYSTPAFYLASTKRIKAYPLYGDVKVVSYDMAGISNSTTVLNERVPATVIQEASSNGEATNDK